MASWRFERVQSRDKKTSKIAKANGGQKRMELSLRVNG